MVWPNRDEKKKITSLAFRQQIYRGRHTLLHNFCFRVPPWPPAGLSTVRFRQNYSLVMLAYTKQPPGNIWPLPVVVFNPVICSIWLIVSNYLSVVLFTRAPLVPFHYKRNILKCLHNITLILRGLISGGFSQVRTIQLALTTTAFRLCTGG